LIKILFICTPDSTHAASWIDLLKNSEFDVRIFSVYHKDDQSRFLPDWNYPTYSLGIPKNSDRIKDRIIKHFPLALLANSFSGIIDDKYHIKTRWLRKIIMQWKPDIIHSFPLNTGGKPTVEVLKRIEKEMWPKWVVSSWGSDLYMGLDGDAKEKERLDFILQNCNGFFSDCKRDLKLAEENGLARDDLIFAQCFPGTGGLDLDFFKTLRKMKQKRNIILVPKAYEREHANRIFPFLEALTLLGSELDNYEIHLLMCSDAVRKWIKKFPDYLQKRCILHDMIPPSDFFDLLGRTRVMAALSLSDGTPNVMLEAMAAGALPLMHPLDSIQEWIKDGENGLLAHALYPDKIAEKLKIGLSDSILLERAHEDTTHLGHISFSIRFKTSTVGFPPVFKGKE